MDTGQGLTELRTADGSGASLRGEILEVRDSGGRLVFEFDTEAGRGVLHLARMSMADGNSGNVPPPMMVVM